MQKGLGTDSMEHQESFGTWLQYVWFNFPLKLIGINLLFLVFCIPVMTIPAALCALHGAVQYFYRGMYYTTVLQTFVKSFLDSFVKRTALFLALILLPTVVMILLWNVLPFPVWLVGAAILLSAVLVILSWWIPQLVYLNLTPLQALKNALIFLCTETYRNFALIAIHAVGMTILIFGLPVTAFLLLVMPVLGAVLVTGIVIPVLKKHLAQ